MKHNLIRYSMIVLLIGLFVVAAVPANAQGEQTDRRVCEVLSFSYGFVRGETARISVTLPRLANPRSPDAPVSMRIQLLDTEGEVIAQSNEIRLAPGQIRFWDAPRELITVSGEPGTGRLQVRTRIVVTASPDFDPERLLPTIEVIDTITGRTNNSAGKTFLIFVSGPNGRSTADQ